MRIKYFDTNDIGHVLNILGRKLIAAGEAIEVDEEGNVVINPLPDNTTNEEEE